VNSLVIGVNYGTDGYAFRFVRSLARYSSENVSVILVDNTEREDVPTFQRRISEENPAVRYLRAPFNLGYFGGANFGLQHFLSTSALPDWVIVCNVDIEFKDEAFFEKLRQLGSIDSLGVVGPRIWSARWKRDLNPKITERPTREKMRFYKVVFGNYYLQIAYETLSYLKNISRAEARALVALIRPPKRDGHPNEHIAAIYAPHGSCLVFNRRYFAAGGSLEYSVFLFGEEIFVGEAARRLGLLVGYCPELRVIDSEHASTGIIRSRRIARHMKDATDYLVHNYFA
jgi:GT2 family glycosyltransferase